jgi:hypothetical protein
LKARLGDALQPRGDIDAIAHRSPSLSSTTDADPKLDALLGRKARVALDHAGLHFDSAAHRIDYTAEFDVAAVAGCA